MIQYVNINVNLESCTSIEAKIAKIDLIIDSLFTVAMTSVLNGDTLQYSLDTGQTKVMKMFNSPKAVTEAIKDYEAIRQMYVNKLTPRNIRLVDNRNFNGR